MQIVTYDQVKDKVISVRNQQVILDSDVAELYGVETKRINEAVKNNPEKFPNGYILELNNNEKAEVVENFDHLQKLKFSSTLPKAFTEKGLYMLATILKSPTAVNTTIAIIDAFAQLKELTNAVYSLAKAKDEAEQIHVLENNIDLIANLLDNELIVSQQETEIKIKLPFFEITRKITKVKK
ncbi:MAG: ORF6N domain-containing protein [Burkholderiales bacterium]|nr:ORF6N domain-containing protein [Burkholderiales bacterium]